MWWGNCEAVIKISIRSAEWRAGMWWGDCTKAFIITTYSRTDPTPLLPPSPPYPVPIYFLSDVIRPYPEIPTFFTFAHCFSSRSVQRFQTEIKIFPVWGIFGMEFKVTMSQDFLLQVFSWIISPQAAENNTRVISNYFENLWRYCICKSRCITAISNIGGKFATGINDTGGK